MRPTPSNCLRLACVLAAAAAAGCASRCSFPQGFAWGPEDSGSRLLAQSLDETSSSEEWFSACAQLVVLAADKRETELRARVDTKFTYSKLHEQPGEFRGAVVAFKGLVLEVRKEYVPRASSRAARIRVYGGTLGTLPDRKLVRFLCSGRSSGGFRAGDIVWLSGYFLDAVEFRGADGREHEAPLIVGPMPNRTGSRMHVGGTLRALDMEGLVPTSRIICER